MQLEKLCHVDPVHMGVWGKDAATDTPDPVLSLSFRQELGWLSVPVSMIVSFLLFGIEVGGETIQLHMP